MEIETEPTPSASSPEHRNEGHDDGIMDEAMLTAALEYHLRGMDFSPSRHRRLPESMPRDTRCKCHQAVSASE